jgi:threonine efflux protein
VNPIAELLLFAGIMAVGQFSPGPDMILLTSTSLRHGGRAGAMMACGIATGLACHSIVALTGGGYVFSRESAFLPYAKIAASLYLAYLAWQVFRSDPAEPRTTDTSQQRHYLRGLLCNLLNPKVALVLTSICAPFLQNSPGLTRPLALGLIIVGQGALLWIAWAYLLQTKALRDGYTRSRWWINRCFAVLLLLLAVMIWQPSLPHPPARPDGSFRNLPQKTGPSSLVASAPCARPLDRHPPCLP